MSPVAPLPESHSASSTNGAAAPPAAPAAGAGSKPHRPEPPPPIVTGSNGGGGCSSKCCGGGGEQAAAPPPTNGMAAMEQQGSGEGDSGSDTGGGWWFKRFRRRVGQWAYAEAEERLPMLRQRGDGTGSPNCQQEERASLLLRRADPGTYVSPRACAALLRQQQETRSLPRSLPEAYHSIAVPRAARPGEAVTWGRRLRTLAAYVGPGYMVAVGYMDPGNWATDIAGGALFEYALLSVVLASSLLAVFLQVLTVKLGIATKRDLAQLCAEVYSPQLSVFLWITAEVAIAACDLAEVIGSAIALQLLFGLPVIVGCCLTALDVLLVLSFFDNDPQPSSPDQQQPPGQRRLRKGRFRLLEAAVAGLILLILGCFAVEVALSEPSLPGVLRGLFLPDLKTMVSSAPQLYIAMGILGATVMPHNLYLHSSLVQTRDYGDSNDDKAEAILYSSLDTVIALGLALFVNAAILVVAAAAFYDRTQEQHKEAPSVAEAYRLLAPILGNKAASVLFGVALLASGQNSTLTGTLAGQIVMEGFVQVKLLRPWLRRLATRLLVVVPAVLTVAIAGQEGVDTLLVLSQVVLSLQLPFAVVPLVAFTSDPHIMGPRFVNGPVTRAFGWAMAVLIALLNAWLVVATVVQGGGDVAT